MASTIKSKAGFIAKLQAILDNSTHQEVISWAQNGNSFLILDSHFFQHHILTSFFRHKRLNSFIRQLNMYGFHKIRGDKTVLEFKHPYFTRKAPEHHHLIDRKKSAQVTFQLPQFIKQMSAGSMKELDPMREEQILPSPVPEEEQILQFPTKFRLNSSQMTIRLTERLTSLCNVQWNEGEQDKDERLSIICSEDHLRWSHQKTQEIDTLLMSEGSGLNLFQF